MKFPLREMRIVSRFQQFQAVSVVFANTAEDRKGFASAQGGNRVLFRLEFHALQVWIVNLEDNPDNQLSVANINLD